MAEPAEFGMTFPLGSSQVAVDGMEFSGLRPGQRSAYAVRDSPKWSQQGVEISASTGQANDAGPRDAANVHILLNPCGDQD